MVILTLNEIFDILVMSLAVGFIFSGIFREIFKNYLYGIRRKPLTHKLAGAYIKQKYNKNPLFRFFSLFSKLTNVKKKKRQKKKYSNIYDFERNRLGINREIYTINPFLISLLITAPAIILHELGHKFTAMAFGLTATFHAAYGWLVFGVILKLINFPFLFFVPAYVSIPLTASPGQMALIAFAGPLVNLLIWFFTRLYYQFNYVENPILDLSLSLIMKINLFLFILNMLPIPGFDGWKVYSGVIQLIIGLF